MRDPVACSLAVVAALLLAIFLPARAILGTAADADRVIGETDPELLYQLAIAATVAELEWTPPIFELRGTILELERSDLEAILGRTFDANDIAEKAGDVHRRLAGWARAFPEDTSFHIPLADETNLLLDVLPDYLEARLEALPNCPVEEDLGILWSVLTDRILGDVDRLEFLRELPHCRPPGIVRSEIVSGLREDVEALRGEAPDSVEAFTVGEGDQAARGWLGFLQLGLRLAVDRPWLPLAAIAACLTAVAVRLRRNGADLGRLLALALASGALAGGAAGIFLLAVEGDTLRRWLVGTEVELREVTFLWMAVVFHAVDGITDAAGRRTLGAALALAAGGVVAPRFVRRSLPGSGQRQTPSDPGDASSERTG